MKVLVACEFSGIVREAFKRHGHDAWSCDLLPTEIPGQHYQGDVFDIIDDPSWELLICHPPCTHLAVSGAAWFAKKRADGRQQQGIDFFMRFTELKCPRVAIENPVGIMSTVWRKPDCIIQPYEHGDSFSKKTCLWLKGLPKIVPTKIVDRGEFVTFASGKSMPKWYAELRGKGHERNRFFPGIADAMATQWSEL